MKKTICGWLFTVLLLCCALTALLTTRTSAAAVTSGYCGGEGDGTNLTWTLDDTGTLTISGAGEMKDYGHSYIPTPPWRHYCRSIVAVDIGDDVTSLGTNAFCHCDSLTSITIPSSVTSISGCTFSACDSLTSIYVDRNNTKYDSRNNCNAIIETATNTLICGCSATLIPDSVTSIASYAFRACNGLTSVLIPNSVTQIGEYAFSECSGLISVVIPNGVKKIDNYTFSGCTNLVSVSIPNSVKEIRNHTFSGCSSLTNITLPDSLTSIGYEAFYYCRSLTSITIPNRATYIANNTFYGCKSLSSVTISNGVTDIGGQAFKGCSSLTSITIPDSVRNIGYSAFRGCASLKSICFLGNAPSSENKAFPTTATLYYIAGMSGWTDSDAYDALGGRWNGCLLKMWDGITIPQDVETTVPAGQYVMQVIDENNAPISGADVTWNAESSQTGWDGKVFFNAFTMGNPVIRVSKTGYIPWTNENSNWKKSTSQFEKVILYPESYGSLKLSSARLKYTKIGTCDLLTKTKILNLRNDGAMIGDLNSGKFDITCLATTADEASGYALYQGTKKIAESSNGEFLALNVRDFTAGGGCFVRVTGKNGKTADTHINLEFAKNSVNKDFQFGIKGNKISFRVSDDVPYVGGSTVTFELPMEAPVIATATPDKIQLGINMNLDPDKSEEQISSYINMIRKAAIVGNQKLTEANTKQFKKMAAKNNKAKFFKDCDFTFCGYAEGDFGSKKASGYLMIIMDLKVASIKYDTVVYFVPVTVQVGADLKMEAGGSVEYNFDTNTWNGNIFLNPEFELKPFFGVGYSDLAGVGVYGRAELSAKWNVFGTQSGLRSVDLTGELGIKAYLGPWEMSKAFAHQTWHLYTANTVGAKALHSAQPAWNDAFATDFTTSDLSYLADESEWDPDYAEPYTAARSSLVQTYASEAKTSYETLLSSTYRNAQPVMISDGNALYAAFVRADADSNARYIAVTKFDGNKWCEPVRVDTNSILDDAPQLCVDESGQVWLAYAQTVEEPGESIVAYAQNQAITVGTIDMNTLAFTKQETYHSGSYMHLQTLSCVDGTPVLAWVDSTVTDENSVAAPNSGIIYMAQYSDGTWTEAREVEEVSQNVDSLCIGVQNGTAIVAYTSGAKLISNGQVAAEDVIGKAVFGRLPGSEDDSFIWSAEGCLRSSSGATVPAENMGREFAIIGNSVYYNMLNDGCANLAVMQYDAENGRWGASSRLIGDDKYLENLNAATLNGQTYVLGMHTTATIEAAGIEDSKDLVWTKIFPVNDLKLESVDFDANTLVPGETLPVTVTVYNAGDHTVTDLTILADGVSLASQNCNILSGESEEITVDITCPSDKRTITFNVQETGAEDYTPEDNETDCTIGFADAELELSFLQIGSQKSLLASVVNRGLESASGSILFSDSTGEILAERTFRNLEYNGAVIAEFVPETFIGLFDSDVTAVVTLDQTELNTLNNTDSVPILISTTGIIAMRQSTDAVKVEVSCMQDKVVKAYCTFYDQYNRMLGVDIQTVNSGKVNELSFAKQHGAMLAKVFVLDDAAVPVCPAETLILQ